jgi:hypothetical protein
MWPFIVRRYGGAKPFSRRAFWASQVCFWLYTIVWFTVLLWIYYYWDSSLLLKLGATVVLALLTPDAHTLFQSYQKYKDEMARYNGTATQAK